MYVGNSVAGIPGSVNPGKPTNDSEPEPKITGTDTYFFGNGTGN